MHTSRRPSQVLIAVVFSLVISLTALPSSAQQSAKGKAAADATTALLQMNSNYQQTPAAQKVQLLTQFRGMAAQRQQLLSSLIQTNPGDVLRVAVPANIRGTMPTAVQAFVEQQVQAQGTLEILHSDFGSPAKGLTGGKFYYHLKTATEVLTLHFAEKTPAHLLTGSVVRASGVRVGSDFALFCCSGTNNSNLQTITAALPNTFGAQSTLVILVNFQDDATQPYTLSSAQDVVFNQTSNFDMENSFQQTWLTGTVVGWYTLPMSSSTCDVNSIASYANQAASSAGVNLANYSHYVYAFPNTSACGWWGLGTIGGSPSQAWIDGTLSLKVVGHEMGHNLGLYHSHGWSCGSATLGTSCSTLEYGDTLDIMGNPSTGHFNAYQKERLGWLNSGAMPAITTITSSGTYQIGPYEAQDSTPKALKILQYTDPTTGSNSWYYVELRQATGEDSFLSNDTNVLGGVVVHTGSDADPNSNELLNLAPSLNSFYTPALDVGQSFVDPTAGVTVQTAGAGTSGASVIVTLGPPVCAQANPTVVITPSQNQWVQSGTPVNFTVTLRDNDLAGCTASTFNLTDTLPAAWNGVFSNSSLTLTPGASGSSTLQVTSPVGTTDGFYNVTVSGTNASGNTYTASASATYVISSVICTHTRPTISMTPAQSLGMLPGSSVVYVVSLLNNDSTGCAASAFAMAGTVPAGWPASLSGSSLTVAPGASGSASLQVSSPATAAPGTYSVSASGTNSSVSGYSGSASASYIVTSPLSITVTTDAAAYSRSQSVNVTATVTSAGSAVAGASVRLLFTEPDSSLLQYLVTTGSNGGATLKFRLGRKSPVGTYTVQASTTTSQGSAQATTSFHVQ